jgi:uncharacterized protein (UPF0548 family)
MSADLNYEAVGATRPEDPTWRQHPQGYRHYERSVPIGRGHSQWESASATLMAWGVKTRSGFRVESARGTSAQVCIGADYRLTASLGPFSLHEPVRVVAVVDQPRLVGFAYGTLDGHPVAGEEAFLVHRDAHDQVWLTLRSLTRPGRGRWRLAFPAVLIAQRFYRFRYLRALRPT